MSWYGKVRTSTATTAVASTTSTTVPGYDLIVLIGQSNMSGRGAAIDTTRFDAIDPRIFQLPNPANANSSGFTDTFILASEPLLMHDAPSGMGPGLVFARHYVNSVPGRRVLLVPAAHGGTGFSTTTVTPTPSGYHTPNAGGGTWEVGGAGVNLLDDGVTHTKLALSMAGGDSRIVAVLWLQGESDAGFLTQTQYAAKLDALIDSFRSRVPEAATAPFVMGQMLPEFIAASASNRAIHLAHLDTQRRKPLVGFATGISGKQNGDDLHYNAAGQRYMGKSMFDAYKRALINTAGNKPVAVTISSLTSPTPTSLLVAWTMPTCRVTDFSVEYSTDGGSTWRTVSRTSPLLDPTQTIATTIGTAHLVRVNTINELGTAASAAASITTLGLPARPSVSSTSASNTSLTVLVSIADASVTSYSVRYRQAGSSTWTVVPSATASVTIGSLARNTLYEIEAAAVNAAGTGAYSVTRTLATANVDPPGQVTGVAAGTATRTTLPLSWTAVSGADAYTVEYRFTNASSWTTGGNTSSTLFTLSNLFASAPYDVRVTGTNIGGTGTPSATVATATNAGAAAMIDTVGVATRRAYSVRKVRSAYAGNAFQALRDTDGATANIGFLANGCLDLGTLATFGQGANVYVRTWYDQSGNNFDLTQASTANTAVVVSSGALLSTNGVLAPTYNGTSSYYSDSSPSLAAAGNATLALVVKGVATQQASGGAWLVAEASTLTNAPQYAPLTASNLTSGGLGFLFRGDTNGTVQQGSTLQALDGNLGVIGMVDSGNNVALRYNSTSSNYAYSRTTTGTITPNTFTLGAMLRTTLTAPFKGVITEAVAWQSALSNVAYVSGENNQRTFYGV